jgi:alkylation response protein AidB-like acyl-CoA dehydrogenase
MTATRVGSDIELLGSKFFVGHFGSAQHCLVAARLDGGADVVLVLVPTNAKGVSAQALSPIAKDAESTVTFDKVRVSAASIVGSASGSASFTQLCDLAAALLASQMEGAARKASEMAVAYVKERNAFGQPIAAFQAIQHLAADVVNGIDGTQLLAREATWRMSVGLPAAIEASQAKAFANERCVMAVRSAQQMHGGIGFIAEFDMQLWYRRVVSWSLRCGTTGEHRARVADALLSGSGPVRLGMSMYPDLAMAA